MSQHIPVQELNARLAAGENIQLIDVRSPGEFAAGHVPRAINIPLEQVEVRLGDLGNQPVALLCQSGKRAGIACDVLANHREDLVIVDGGTSAWQAAGLPIVASTTAKWSLERQVRLIAGLLVLIGTILSVTGSPSLVYLAMFVGGGLTFAGLTNLCPMATMLAKLPWNKAATCSTTPSNGKVTA